MYIEKHQVAKITSESTNIDNMERSLKVMNKWSSSNMNQIFVQSDLLFNNVLKIIIHTAAMERVISETLCVQCV